MCAGIILPPSKSTHAHTKDDVFFQHSRTLNISCLKRTSSYTSTRGHAPFGQVLLAYPVNRSVSMRAGDTIFSASLSEGELPNDATSGSRWRNMTFNAYSPSGQVEGDLVYANYGSPDDFDALARMGVSVENKIVIMRYGSTFRGLKVMNAERRGAIGVVIYSDPMEDGYAVGKTYPDGPWRPADSVQRGSVQFNSLCAGDPARLYSNQSTLELCGFEMQDVIPKIPVLPMSWADALPLLQHLSNPSGVTPPADFQGGLPLVYQTGPGPARVSLDVNNDIHPGVIHNIYATIPGVDYGTPDDRMVVLGNHRDAWVFGAVDPNSGTAALLEVSRAFGTLLREGWRPRRTIVLCSWDGEEYGLLGSTAWGETHASFLSDKAVAYLNVDVGVSGQNLSVHVSGLLSDVVRGAIQAVTDPASGKPLSEVWDGVMGDLGSGSDYTVFLDRLGIPSLDLSFRQGNAPTSYGVYHSVYDSFSYMQQQIDPDFKYHVVQAQLWGLIALRLASERVVPLAPVPLALDLHRYIAYIQALFDGTQCAGQCTHIHTRVRKSASARRQHSMVRGGGLDLSPLQDAVARFEGAAMDAALAREIAICSEERVQKRWQRARGAGVGGLNGVRRVAPPEVCGPKRLKRLNEALRLVERAFLDEAGLPSRKWFRHVLQAPGLYLGYGADLFPGICQAIRDGNLVLAQEQVGVCSSRVLAAVTALNSWMPLPSAHSSLVV